MYTDAIKTGVHHPPPSICAVLGPPLPIVIVFLLVLVMRKPGEPMGICQPISNNLRLLKILKQPQTTADNLEKGTFTGGDWPS